MRLHEEPVEFPALRVTWGVPCGQPFCNVVGFAQRIKLV